MTPAERPQMMLNGPIVPAILTLAAPNALSVAMQGLVSISDGFFIAVCGSLFALDVMGWGTRGLFTFVALGIVSFSAILAFSTTRPAWRAQPPGSAPPGSGGAPVKKREIKRGHPPRPLDVVSGLQAMIGHVEREPYYGRQCRNRET